MGRSSALQAVALKMFMYFLITACNYSHRILESWSGMF